MHSYLKDWLIPVKDGNWRQFFISPVMVSRVHTLDDVFIFVLLFWQIWTYAYLCRELIMNSFLLPIQKGLPPVSSKSVIPLVFTSG